MYRIWRMANLVRAGRVRNEVGEESQNMLDYRVATLDDVSTLAKMNRELTEDEKHRNRLKPDSWFEERMRGFLTGKY